MKNLFTKILFYTLISINATIHITKDVSAQPDSRESALCANQDLITILAFSTEEYNVAICKEFESQYYYAGQEIGTNNKIFLPISEINNPHEGANPWLIKAKNGQFTYQIAEFNPLEDQSYVSLSVFKNGNRIYHSITDVYAK
jgi:hypothetical protein